MKRTVILAGGLVQTVMLISLCTTGLHAQYTAAVGTRTGGTSGITGTYFYKSDAAVEALLGSFGNGFSVTGLVKKYGSIYYVKGLYVYHGGGLHVAVYHGKDGYYGPLGREVNYHRNYEVGFGVNAVAGAEYRMPRNIPLSFSIEMKPFVEVGSGGHVSVAPDPSIGVKFIIR